MNERQPQFVKIGLKKTPIGSKPLGNVCYIPFSACVICKEWMHAQGIMFCHHYCVVDHIKINRSLSLGVIAKEQISNSDKCETMFLSSWIMNAVSYPAFTSAMLINHTHSSQTDIKIGPPTLLHSSRHHQYCTYMSKIYVDCPSLWYQYLN